MEILVRNYLNSDFKFVKEILLEAHIYDEIWDSEDNLESKIKEDTSSVLVAVINNKIVGNILIDMHGKNVAFFYRLAVKEEFRNKGIGKKLLERAEEVVKEKGVKEIAFYVNSKKPDLQLYYQKKGYVSLGNNYICMWKKI